MKSIIKTLTILLFISCSNTSKNSSNKNHIDSTAEAAKWADEHINRYLDNNEHHLKEIDGHPIEYIKETTSRLGRNYAIAKIGHFLESRFVTAQWIFIDSITKDIYEYDLANDSLILWNESQSSMDESSEIPGNGKYDYDIAFDEWEGKSMGEKVTVIINNKSIKVIYEGDGKHLNAKKGEVIESGTIMKHKTGVWIIGKKSSDTQVDEIGACSGGPTIIDFKKKKFHMC